jgi:RNA polymerase sigma-70 factor (ECF subfamily)
MGEKPGAEDDHEIVELVQAGDRAAFSRLVEGHQRMVHALALRMTGSPAEADDVTQQSFMNAFRNIERFRGEATFKTWIYGIALNECRMRHRRSGRLVSVESLPEVEAPRVEGDVLGRQHLSLLVERLPEKQRAAVMLRIRDDLSFREVGALIGSSEASAKVSFFHAMKKLRGWLSESEEEA